MQPRSERYEYDCGCNDSNDSEAIWILQEWLHAITCLLLRGYLAYQITRAKVIEEFVDTGHLLQLSRDNCLFGRHQSWRTDPGVS